MPIFKRSFQFILYHYMWCYVALEVCLKPGVIKIHWHSVRDRPNAKEHVLKRNASNYKPQKHPEQQPPSGTIACRYEPHTERGGHLTSDLWPGIWASQILSRGSGKQRTCRTKHTRKPAKAWKYARCITSI